MGCAQRAVQGSAPTSMAGNRAPAGQLDPEASEKRSLSCSKRTQDGRRSTLVLQPSSGLFGNAYRLLVSETKGSGKPQTLVDVSGLRCQIIDWKGKLSAVCVKPSSTVGSGWHSLFARAHIVPHAVGPGFEFDYSFWHLTDDFNPDTGAFDVVPHLQLHETVQHSTDWRCGP